MGVWGAVKMDYTNIGVGRGGKTDCTNIGVGRGGKTDGTNIKAGSRGKMDYINIGMDVGGEGGGKMDYTNIGVEAGRMRTCNFLLRYLLLWWLVAIRLTADSCGRSRSASAQIARAADATGPCLYKW